MLRVVMWSTDPVGKQMAGPGIRYHRLATELAGRFEVTLVAPGKAFPARRTRFDRPSPYEAAATSERTSSSRRACRSASSGGLRRAGVRSSSTSTRPRSSEAAAHLADSESARPVAPHPLRGGRRDDTGRAPARRRIPLRQRATARPLAGRARRARAGHTGDLRRRPALRSLVDVVPFGLDPPRRTLGVPAVKGVLPGIGRPTGCCSGAEASGTGSTR